MASLQMFERGESNASLAALAASDIVCTVRVPPHATPRAEIAQSLYAVDEVFYAKMSATHSISSYKRARAIVLGLV